MRYPAIERLKELMDMGYTFTFEGRSKVISVIHMDNYGNHWHVEDYSLNGQPACEEQIKHALWDEWWEKNQIKK